MVIVLNFYKIRKLKMSGFQLYKPTEQLQIEFIITPKDQTIMSVQDPLLGQQNINSTQEIGLFSQRKQKINPQKNTDQQQKKQKVSPTRRIKFVLTVLAIILTSFLCSHLTTDTLDHSRNFIRFLNYYLIDHTGFDIYWAGQYMLNYPINQYFQITEVVDFLQTFQDTMTQLDENVYGFVDFDGFLNANNSINLILKQGHIQSYNYIIANGFAEPFQINNLDSIKQSILACQQIQITLKPFNLNQHEWNIMISITTFSQSSIFVRIYAKENIQLWQEHITTFIVGVLFFFVLGYEYFIHKNHMKISDLIVQNVPEYLLCVLLINTFVFSLTQEVDIQWLVIFDGIQCLISWLLILKFLQKEDDYHISFLIRKSYVLVGNLFISFGPIFIAFTLFAYALFCRQAWQFSTYKRTFLNLFYICYYNMTYQSFIVTSRANPISMIFFFVFVILFTICVYSGMLVSVFCSYVWNKRESKIKQDIINNLKIQCSECDTKYKYIDCLNNMKNSKKSLRISFVLQTDFSSSDSRYQYKKAVQKKIQYLTKSIYNQLQQAKQQVSKQRSQVIRSYSKKQIFQKVKQKIKTFIKEEFLCEEQIKTKDKVKLN